MQNTQDSLQHKTSALAAFEGFLQTAPKEAAQMLETLPLNEAVFWASSLKAQSIIAALENMAPKKAAVLLRRLPFKQASQIIPGLNAERAGEVFLALPPHYKQKLLAGLEPGAAKALESVLAAPHGSAARMMGGNYFTFKTDSKVKDIIFKLKALPKNKIPFAVYILDKSGKLAGVLKTAELALYSPEAAAGALMQTQFESLAPLDNADIALGKFKTANALTLPVVDGEGFLAGVLPAREFMKAPQNNPKKYLPKNTRRKILAAFILGFFSALALYLILVWIFI